MRLTLNGKPIPAAYAPASDTALRSSFEYIISITNENIKLNEFIAELFRKMMAAYRNEKNLTIKAQRLAQTQSFYCVIAGFEQSDAHLLSEYSIDSLVAGAMEDANQSRRLQKIAQKLLDSEQVDIAFLTTWYLTLTWKLQRMQDTPNQSQPEMIMIAKIIRALESVVEPKTSFFEKTLAVCQNTFEFKRVSQTTGSMASSATTHNNHLFFKPEFSGKYVRALGRLLSKDNVVFAEERAELEACIANDARVMQNIKPNCYSLSQDNSRLYIFHTLYVMVDIYQRIQTKTQQIKESEQQQFQQELQEQLTEIDSLIEEGRQLSRQKHQQNSTAAQEYEEDNSMLSSSSECGAAAAAKITTQLDQLALTHLRTLSSLFKNKAPLSAIHFNEVESAIRALGGRIHTFTGSRTRIYLPNATASIPNLNLVGGLHIPHGNKALHFIQCRLICKALERSGITKDAVSKILAAKTTPPVLHATPLTTAAATATVAASSSTSGVSSANKRPKKGK